MLRLVQSVDVDTEERIWEEAGKGWIREADVDEPHHKKTERGGPSPLPAPNVGIVGPDHAVTISIPVIHMLLHYLHT